MPATIKLYVIPLSHPAYSARLMLEHKGMQYEVVRLLSGFHPLLLRVLGFAAGTVPALRLDGRRVQGSLAISRALDRARPEPPLFPADPERRERVVEAEAWGERELQPIPRRLFRWALTRDARVRRELARINGLPFPGLSGVMIRPLAAVFARKSRAYDANVRADMARLPALLDRVDGLIADGILDGPELNAADFQIGPSVRLLLTCDDVRGLVDGRPAAGLAHRLLPDYPARLPRVLPPGWVREEASS